MAISRVELGTNLIFFDDDLQVNRFTAESLIGSLNGGATVATGYSVEVPVVPGFVDDLIAVYRAINLLAFSST